MKVSTFANLLWNCFTLNFWTVQSLWTVFACCSSSIRFWYYDFFIRAFVIKALNLPNLRTETITFDATFRELKNVSWLDTKSVPLFIAWIMLTKHRSFALELCCLISSKVLFSFSADVGRVSLPNKICCLSNFIRSKFSGWIAERWKDCFLFGIIKVVWETCIDLCQEEQL